MTNQETDYPVEFKYKYEYVNLLEHSFTRFKVTRARHNSVFRCYRKRTLWTDLMKSYEYYEKHDYGFVHTLPSLLAKIIYVPLAVILSPLDGIANKEYWNEVKRFVFPKKYGAFLSDRLSEKDLKALKGIK